MNWMPAGRNFQNRLELAKLFGITGITQVAIQGIGLLSGILVIRLLPLEEYALYTLANTMLGTMVVLADSGIASGVTAQGGKVWQDRDALGEVMVTGLDLRKKFAVGSLLLAAPILIYLLLHHGAHWSMAILLVLSLIPAFMSSLTGALFTVPLKLNQDIKPLQKNVFFESIGRFALVFLLFLTPWAFIAILGAGIPRIYANIRLRKLSDKFANWNQTPNIQVRNRIMKMVKRLMPESIYYCVSGQIGVWLISIFGNTENVAHLGALGRIAVVSTLIGSIYATLIYPRFARLHEESKILFKRFVLVMMSLTGIFALIVFLVWTTSTEILWVFGDDYVGLELALVLSIISSALGTLRGGAFTMSTQRGWIIHPALSISVSLFVIILGAILFDVSTLIGVLIFNIVINMVQLSFDVGYFFFKLKRQES